MRHGLGEQRNLADHGAQAVHRQRPRVHLHQAAQCTERADAYYFTAIDFKTGKTVYRVLTGTGVRYDNNWAAISLAPDGTAYVGVLNGLVRVRDRRAAHAEMPYADNRRRDRGSSRTRLGR